MLNNITLIGRWTKDTEIIVAGNGTEILNGSLAVSDPFRQDHTDFIDIVAFNKTALNANKFTGKGSKVGIVGKLQQERWESKEGQKRNRHVVVANQIVFLDEKGSKPQSDAPSKEQSHAQAQGEPIDISNDSLPF